MTCHRRCHNFISFFLLSHSQFLFFDIITGKKTCKCEYLSFSLCVCLCVSVCVCVLVWVCMWVCVLVCVWVCVCMLLNVFVQVCYEKTRREREREIVCEMGSRVYNFLYQIRQVGSFFSIGKSSYWRQSS
jgi:hypothetical protein